MVKKENTLKNDEQLKLCKNCVHFIDIGEHIAGYTYDTPRCGRRLKTSPMVDLVTGEMYNEPQGTTTTCYDERQDYTFLENFLKIQFFKVCGRRGRFFKQKENND